MAVFQECWEIIKDDLLKVIEEFHNHRKICRALNSEFISLIPRKNGAKQISDYLPISLVIEPYKIISKVVMNTLKNVIHVLLMATSLPLLQVKILTLSLSPMNVSRKQKKRLGG